MTPDQTQLLRSPLRTVEGLDRTLLAQCGIADVDAVRRIVNRPGTGLVVTARQGNLPGVYRWACYLVEKGYDRPLLLDANRYGGNRRLPANTPFSSDWLGRQRELGLPVLTDSGYVGWGDLDGLVAILRRTAMIGDAIALLPLHLSWLRVPSARDTLLRQVRAFAVPVAIIVEYQADPFGVRGVVDGLIELLNCDVPLLLLRSDISALGALCCGAVAAAVGTRAALRHLYPMAPQPARRRWSRPAPSVVVSGCLSYKRLGTVARTKRRHPDSNLWWCGCSTCEGRDLDWILHRPERMRERLSFQHSLDALVELRDELIGPDPQRDQLTWRARCASAAYWRREVGWEPLPALDRWQQAIGLPPSDDPAFPLHRPGRSIPPQRGSERSTSPE
ncbi:hypothetical protein ACFP2T_15270 [Plantactinospora solaniradicis]|uniref:Uncharacterized protein n=1 Tax=Plantactinospora solaniradicis TaxID=1723736 RepID=A0ABW1K8S0_9ACTN